jgi:hypothetical protein
MEPKPIMDDEDAYRKEACQMRSIIKKLCELIEMEGEYDTGSNVDVLIKEAKKYYEKI